MNTNYSISSNSSQLTNSSGDSVDGAKFADIFAISALVLLILSHSPKWQPLTSYITDPLDRFFFSGKYEKMKEEEEKESREKKNLQEYTKIYMAKEKVIWDEKKKIEEDTKLSNITLKRIEELESDLKRKDEIIKLQGLEITQYKIMHKMS